MDPTVLVLRCGTGQRCGHVGGIKEARPGAHGPGRSLTPPPLGCWVNMTLLGPGLLAGRPLKGQN